MSAPAHVEIDRARLRRLLERERARFAEQHPRSREARGVDFLRDGPGDDQVYGGRGDDWITASRGHDQYRGGPGEDLVDFFFVARFAPITANLTSGRASASGSTARLWSIQNLLGGRAADTLIGNAAANKLTGDAGNDTIFGRAGKDKLAGAPGTDRLNGGPGTDTCTTGETTKTANSFAVALRGCVMARKPCMAFVPLAPIGAQPARRRGSSGARIAVCNASVAGHDRRNQIDDTDRVRQPSRLRHL